MDTKCNVEGCTTKPRRANLCDKHKWRLKMYGCLDPVFNRSIKKGIYNFPRICPVEGCGNIVQNKKHKYCYMHGSRLRRHGSFDLPPKTDWRLQGTITKQGYRRLTCIGHPMANKRGKILEHRLIMYEHLGRVLLPNENIHHKNGNRLDNRIENLELWVKAQPTGQRVEDIVKYAEEILLRYAPEKTSRKQG